MANKTGKPSKAASLTGDLLVRGNRDTKVGFVLTPLEDLEPEGFPASEEAKPPSAASVLNTQVLEERIPPPDASAESPVAKPRVQVGAWSNPTAQTNGPQALVQALREGRLERAEQLFGAMTGLAADKMRTVLYGETGRDLALACRALGFDHLQFASTLILSRKLGLDEADSDPTVLGVASELFEGTPQEAALDVLRRWRQDQSPL